MAAPSVVCFVNSVAQSIRQDDFEIVREVNARDTLVATIRNVRPTLGQPVVCWINSATEFGGIVRRIDEGGHADTYYSTLSATSWEVYCDTIYVTASFAAGQTIAQVVTSLHGTYLNSLGITLVAVTDATVLAAQTYTRRTLTDVLNELAGLSATTATWRISPEKALSWEAAGTTAAPWDVDAASLDPLGEVTTAQEETSYVNRVRVVGGSYSLVPYTGAHAGNGTINSFALDFAIGGPLDPDAGGAGLVGLPVYVDGALVGTFGEYGVDSSAWLYRAADNTVYQNSSTSPLANASTLTYDTMVQYPAEVVSQDDAEIAARGVWEGEPILYPDVYAYATLKASANAILAGGILRPIETTYDVRRSGLIPGMLQTITLPRRNLTGSWLIQGVSVRGEGNSRLRWTVRAASVAVARPGELALYERWSAGGVVGSGGISSGGGTVVVSYSRLHAHLGGSRTELLLTAAWTPIVGYQTFTCPASGAYTFRHEAQTENAGTSVQVRLYDVTSAAAVAGSTSTASTATSWTEVSAAVSLTAGHKYRAEVIGSNATYGVQCGQATVEM